MSVSASYLEASCIFAAATKEKSDLEILVNISQMTVSQMSLTNMTNSPQQKMHWLAEQVMNWSGVPVVHVRATAFLEHFFSQIGQQVQLRKGALYACLLAMQKRRQLPLTTLPE
jgi:uncharacterized protein YbjT (DUF2867 family)